MSLSDARVRGRASVLVVDGDARVRSSVITALRHVRLEVGEAATGTAAIALLRSRSFAMSLINAQLPDLAGLDVIVTLKRDRISVPWLLMGSHLTAHLAVEAMRLGAIDAVEWPFDVAGVVRAALDDVHRSDGAEWPPLPSPVVLTSPRSAAERLAFLVLRGCAADHDLRTIDDWARAAGTSRSALADACRLAGMLPHDARDFLRILRALYQARGDTASLVHRLNVSDQRTVKGLLDRAGLAAPTTGPTLSLREFIARQRFVDATSEAIRLMLAIIDDARDERASPPMTKPPPR